MSIVHLMSLLEPSRAVQHRLLNPPPTYYPPQNVQAPSVYGANLPSRNLICLRGFWTNFPTFTYQWKSNGVNIPGATSASYKVTYPQAFTSMSCVVTATNSAGSLSVESAAIGPGLVAPDTTNMLMWYDVADPSVITVDSNNQITAFRDKSPTARNAVVPAGLNGPVLATDQFESGAMKFISSEGLQFPPMALADSTTTFMVIYWNTDNFYSSIGLNGREVADTGGDFVGVFSSGSLPGGSVEMSVGTYGTSGAAFYYSQANTVSTGKHIVVFRPKADVASSTVTVDGVVPSLSTPVGTAWSLDVQYLGAQTGLYGGNNGEIAELIVYQGSLSDSEVASINDYLKGKWGL